MRLWLKEWISVIAFLVAMILLGLVLFVVLGPMKVHDGSVTAIATAVIGVFTFTLWLTARNQLRHTREIERAYLTCGGDYTRDRQGQIVVNNAGKRLFQVHVGNYGKTPAFVSSYDVHFAKLDDLRPEAFARPVSPSRRHEDRLAPGGHTKAIIDIEIPGNEDVVYGAFWYQDIWKKDHMFRFLLRLGPERTLSDVTEVHEDYWDWS
jgi:hypothetical protein